MHTHSGSGLFYQRPACGYRKLFRQDDIPMWLIIFGVVGQFTFTLRFVYQWWYSRRAGESLLPITFWLISLTGSAMIIAYAILRRDPVLILGQATGFIVYIRNIMIAMKSKRNGQEEALPAPGDDYPEAAGE